MLNKNLLSKLMLFVVFGSAMNVEATDPNQTPTYASASPNAPIVLILLPATLPDTPPKRAWSKLLRLRAGLNTIHSAIVNAGRLSSSSDRSMERPSARGCGFFRWNGYRDAGSMVFPLTFIVCVVAMAALAPKGKRLSCLKGIIDEHIVNPIVNAARTVDKAFKIFKIISIISIIAIISGYQINSSESLFNTYWPSIKFGFANTVAPMLQGCAQTAASSISARFQSLWTRFGRA